MAEPLVTDPSSAEDVGRLPCSDPDSGDGFGDGPELLDELTRVRVVHVEAAPSADAADLGRR